MERVIAKNDRETWVDNVKILACVLVVIGHFFQSMVKCNIIQDIELYQWFQQTIYYFHVPLFFICSGYLYQKLTVVNDFSTWKKNIIKKLLNLGIPFLTFSLITYFMKEIFSSSVNTGNKELFDSIFVHPISPYWFLYILFFLFLVTPTFKNIVSARLGVAIAFMMKILELSEICGWPYFFEKILSFEIWFVLGMGLCTTGINSLAIKERLKKRNIVVSVVVFMVFIAISVVVYRAKISAGIIPFLCGLLACSSILCFFMNIEINNKFSDFCIKYTMPVFLMHTIFAAGFRSVLLKIGIEAAEIHIIVGLIASFVGPVVTAYIMENTKYLEFFLYPNKFITLKNSKKL